MRNLPKVVLLIEASRGVGRNLLGGIVTYIKSKNDWACYRPPPSYAHSEKKDIALWVKSLNADGIISHDHYSNEIKCLIDGKTPMVIASLNKTEYPGLPTFSDEGIVIGQMGADHLLKKGLKDFAFFGLRVPDEFRNRAKGFSDAIRQAGKTLHFFDSAQLFQERIWESKLENVVKWLNDLPKPIGIMAYADDYSQQIVDACKIAKLKIPDDVAIIGVDNDRLICNLSTPPLSSIALAYERAGYEIANLLDNLMNGQKMKGQQVIIKATHVAVRQSSDILHLDDMEVMRAVRFIHQNADRPLQVEDVVAACNLSRRALQKRFKAVLGCSVSQEIQRQHIESIARMLIETNLPINQIALKMGHSGVEHISRYFRAGKGCSCTEYREMYGLTLAHDIFGSTRKLKVHP